MYYGLKPKKFFFRYYSWTISCFVRFFIFVR